MNKKQRIVKLEQVQKVKTGAPRYIIFWDAYDDMPAIFDGVEMTQHEAEAKAAAMPKEALVVHICYVDGAEWQQTK